MKRAVFLMAGIIFFLVNSVNAISENKTDTTYLGYDYPRKVLEKDKLLTNSEVDKKYKNLLNRFFILKKRSEHNEATLEWLKQDQENWLSYRESHCWLQAYVYVYPAKSKMFNANYNACVSEMNRKRIRFMGAMREEMESE